MEKRNDVSPTEQGFHDARDDCDHVKRASGGGDARRHRAVTLGDQQVQSRSGGANQLHGTARTEVHSRTVRTGGAVMYTRFEDVF